MSLTTLPFCFRQGCLHERHFGLYHCYQCSRSSCTRWQGIEQVQTHSTFKLSPFLPTTLTQVYLLETVMLPVAYLVYILAVVVINYVQVYYLISLVSCCLYTKTSSCGIITRNQDKWTVRDYGTTLSVSLQFHLKGPSP